MDQPVQSSNNCFFPCPKSFWYCPKSSGWVLVQGSSGRKSATILNKGSGKTNHCPKAHDLVPSKQRPIRKPWLHKSFPELFLVVAGTLRCEAWLCRVNLVFHLRGGTSTKKITACCWGYHLSLFFFPAMSHGHTLHPKIPRIRLSKRELDPPF